MAMNGRSDPQPPAPAPFMAKEEKHRRSVIALFKELRHQHVKFQFRTNENQEMRLSRIDREAPLYRYFEVYGSANLFLDRERSVIMVRLFPDRMSNPLEITTVLNRALHLPTIRRQDLREIPDHWIFVFEECDELYYITRKFGLPLHPPAPASDPLSSSSLFSSSSSSSAASSSLPSGGMEDDDADANPDDDLDPRASQSIASTSKWRRLQFELKKCEVTQDFYLVVRCDGEDYAKVQSALKQLLRKEGPGRNNRRLDMIGFDEGIQALDYPSYNDMSVVYHQTSTGTFFWLVCSNGIRLEDVPDIHRPHPDHLQLVAYCYISYQNNEQRSYRAFSPTIEMFDVNRTYRRRGFGQAFLNIIKSWSLHQFWPFSRVMDIDSAFRTTRSKVLNLFVHHILDQEGFAFWSSQGMYTAQELGDREGFYPLTNEVPDAGYWRRLYTETAARLRHSDT